MTVDARDCLCDCDVIIGYKKYLDLVEPVVDITDVSLERYSIGDEEERAVRSIERARNGETVALVSSGDAGIYGMGAALFEVLEREEVQDVSLNVRPGVTAMSAVSSLLGAPLGQDFASISLSDLLTPWESIKDRVEHAAKGDFVIAFYNPKSDNRMHQIEDALEIVGRHRSKDTPVGMVRDAYRSEQTRHTTTLEYVDTNRIDMLTTVILGNSETRTFGDWIYTPRGYLSEVARS